MTCFAAILSRPVGGARQSVRLLTQLNEIHEILKLSLMAEGAWVCQLFCYS